VIVADDGSSAQPLAARLRVRRPARGFTTFSSFGLDTFTLAHAGRPGAAAINMAIQVAVGCGLVAAGYTAAVRLH